MLEFHHVVFEIDAVEIIVVICVVVVVCVVIFVVFLVVFVICGVDEAVREVLSTSHCIEHALEK